MRNVDDIKSVIRSCISVTYRQYNDQKKKDKGQTIIYKTLHRKLKIEQPESHKKTGAVDG